MSRIQWDTEGQKFYEFGVSKGVLFVKDTNGYGNGVPWNGLTAVNENPTGGEAQDLWADDILYGSFRSTERYEATIEAYTYPDEFAACDGSAEIAPGAYLGQQGRKRFGFAFETKIGSDADDGDPSAYRLKLVYGASAKPSGKDHSTVNDSPDATTFSWEVDTLPVAVTGHKPTATFELDSRTVDAAKLKQIEDLLYGTETNEPKLPMPDEIIQILTGKSPTGK